MVRLTPGSAAPTGRRGARQSRRRLVTVLLAVLAVLVGPTAVARAAPGDGSSSTTSSTSTTSTTAPSSTTTTTAPETTTTTTAPETTTTTSEPGTTTTTKPDTGPSTTVAPGTPAQNDPSVVEGLKAGNDELNADELELLQKFLDAQGEVNSITDELIKINEQYLASQQQMLDAINRVHDADDRLRRTNDQLAKAQDELDTEQRRLQQDAVAAYVGGGRGLSSVRAMIKAETVDDLSKSRIYVSAVAEDETDLIEHYRDLHRQVDDLRRQADQDRSDAVAARDAMVARQNALDSQRDALLEARTKKQDVVEEKVQLLAEVENRRGDFMARYQEHRHSGDSVEALLAKHQAGQSLPASTVGIFRQPLERYKLTQSYGNHTNSLYGTGSFHPGIDMAISSGTPIYAPADGVVLMAEYYDGYGNCTVIDHGNGLGTLYGHQTQFAVQEGDHVAAGQVIGYVGSTGYSTGPHLHWEVRVFGATDDPIPYMRPS